MRFIPPESAEESAGGDAKRPRQTPLERWARLSLGYPNTQGELALREEIAWGLYEGALQPRQVLGVVPAEGILLATERYDGADPVNLGTCEEVTIADLAGKIRELTGYQGELRWNTDKPDGQPRRCLDTQKAEALFGFRAQTGFDEGLRETIRWWEEADQG